MTTSTQNTNKSNLSVTNVMTTALIAGGIAAVVNAIVYLLLQGQFEGVVLPMGGADGTAFSVVPVIFSTIAFILVGGVVMLVLDRFVVDTIRSFRILAIVALLLSFAQPMLIPDLPTGAYATLIVLHIIAGVIAIYMLTTRVKPQ